MILNNAIRQRNEEQKKLGLEMDATCQICLKTKFADGIGHICNYCNTRCCARCGGKLTLRSNKVCNAVFAKAKLLIVMFLLFSLLGHLGLHSLPQETRIAD